MATPVASCLPPPSSLLYLLLFLLPTCLYARSTITDPNDAAAMREVARSFTVSSSAALGWDATTGDPCSWRHVSCSSDGHVTSIQIGEQNLSGSLSPAIANLTYLQRLELMNNALSGPLPSLSQLSSLQILLIHDNNLTSIPNNFFAGLTSLQTAIIDNNPFSVWELTDSIQGCSGLVNFTATNTNLTGAIPEFMGTAFPALLKLSLSYNYLEGPVPASFSLSPVRILILNGQKSLSKLSGSIHFLQGMSSLEQLWLHSNSFSGPLPDFSNLTFLQDLELRDNRLTGPVPGSLTGLRSLLTVALTNNLLQGPVPVFGKGVNTDLKVPTEKFCLPQPGPCDPRVEVLLDIAGGLNYPISLASSWEGNDPCSGWLGVTCDAGTGGISVINFKNMGLSGIISPAFANLTGLRQIVLASNNIYGVIPQELTLLGQLSLLDVSNNSLWGKVPEFGFNVKVDVSSNPRIGMDGPPPTGSGVGNGENSPDSGASGWSKSASVGLVVGLVIGILLFLCSIVAYCFYRKKKKTPTFVLGSSKKPTKVVSEPEGGVSELKSNTAPNNFQLVEVGNKMSLELLKRATSNFSEQKVLGRGGFGTVYLGVIDDGTKVAVKRMETGLMGSKGVSEFHSEIDVLTKVRHRNLVSLLGYCWEGNERLLVYEYMPQGTLSHHLFDWQKIGTQPLPWMKRLSIALDVGRGVEYLHSMAHQSFIHRDLKPSNILLDDDMQAKVADFGLVRLAPGGKNVSVETRLAGTFGYLAPEYAVTGRLTTKADVYSFGVILMEIISGRKSLDDKQTEENIHLATWFRRMFINKAIREVIDTSLEQEDDDIFKSITTVAELACHCCAREPYQRPDMGHAVNVISSLVEKWKPVGTDEDDYSIDVNMTLPEVLQRWQAFEDSSQLSSTTASVPLSTGNTQTSATNSPISIPSVRFAPEGR